MLALFSAFPMLRRCRKRCSATLPATLVPDTIAGGDGAISQPRWRKVGIVGLIALFVSARRCWTIDRALNSIWRSQAPPSPSAPRSLGRGHAR
jgi:uncharacterized BrkB/YihY/UPF0761 family membrane protein